jgi:GST-like protein
MIDLYTFNTSNGRKVSIALEEMGLPYNAHPVDIYKDEQFHPDFLAISPNNKIPAIHDRDTGETLFESGAILLYLAEKTGRFMPQDTSTRWQAIQWLMWQMGGVGPMLGQAAHFLQYNPGASAYSAERYGKEAKRLYGVLNGQLEGRDYIVGDYSIVDMAVFPWITRFEHQRINLLDYPNVSRWYLSVASRPAVARGYAVPDSTAAIPCPEREAV